MSDTDAATMAKCLPWLTRVIEDELIPLLRELRDRLPREAKPAPSAFAQPELPGIAHDPETGLTATFRDPPQSWRAPQDTADLPNGLEWTNPEQYPPPGTIARQIAARPRSWSNTVKVYDAIWVHFGNQFRKFGLADLCRDNEFLSAVANWTKNRVAPSSLSKMLSVMRRAGAIYLDGKGVYRCNEPSDAIRERIEAVARKSNDHSNKEKVA